jgi:hypothetical protein
MTPTSGESYAFLWYTWTLFFSNKLLNLNYCMTFPILFLDTNLPPPCGGAAPGCPCHPSPSSQPRRSLSRRRQRQGPYGMVAARRSSVTTEAQRRCPLRSSATICMRRRQPRDPGGLTAAVQRGAGGPDLSPDGLG